MPDTKPEPLWRINQAPFTELSGYVKQIAEEHRSRTGRTVPLQVLPSEAELAQFVETALWATVRPDEGRYPRFSLVFALPEPGCIEVEERPFTPENVAKLAPVTTGPSRIGVRRREGGGLVIWGINPGRTSYVEVRSVGPGHVVVAMGLWNLAIFQGNESRSLIKQDPAFGVHGLGREHVAAIISGSFATTQSHPQRTVTGIVLLMALDAIRAQGNGGTLLILPEDNACKARALEWLDLGPNRIHTAVGLQRAYEEYAKLLEGEGDPLVKACETPGLREYLQGHREEADPRLLQATTVLGNLSATDGAVVVTERLELIGFGATIRSSGPGRDRVEQICRKSILDAASKGEDVHVQKVGGTRRQSAALFVANNFDTAALTASHDGPLSLAIWGAYDPETRGPRAVLFSELENLLD